MYKLKITNNYRHALIAETKKIINPKGDSATFDKLGDLIVDIPGMGPVNFLDLGKEKLGYLDETWGVLIRYRAAEFIYRYEGGGDLEAEVDNLGTVHIQVNNGKGFIIKLPDLKAKGTDIAVENKED